MRLPSFLGFLIRPSASRAPGPGQGGRANAEGQALLDRLDRFTRARAPSGPRGRLGNGMAALEVSLQSRLGAGGTNSAPCALDANWVLEPRTLVMAVPAGARDIHQWARACRQAAITDVIDLSPPESGEPGWVTAPILGTDDGTGFKLIGPPLSRNIHRDSNIMARTGMDDARERRIQVNGPATDAEMPWTFTWNRLPLPAGSAPAPELLLQLCHYLQAREMPSSPPRVAAFQDANGGNMAAVFAVALDLFRMHRESPLDRRSLESALLDACDRARDGRSQALFTGRPDLLGALKAFGESMIDEPRPPALPGLAEPPPPVSARPVPMPARRVRIKGTAQAARVVGRAPTSRSIDTLVNVRVRFDPKGDLRKVSGEALAAAQAWINPTPDDDQDADGSDIASSR
jgi:hypothetical protein